VLFVCEGAFFLRLTFILFVITNLLVLCFSKTAIANVTMVAILPLQVNADEDIEYINKSIVEMLVSRITYGTHITIVDQNMVKDVLSKELSGKLTNRKIKKIGDALGADYVIFGSISKIGNNLSIDINVLNVLQEGMIIPAFTQSVGLDEAVSRINILAQEVRDAISTGFRDLMPKTTTATHSPVADRTFKDSKVSEVVPGKVKGLDLTGNEGEKVSETENKAISK